MPLPDLPSLRIALWRELEKEAGSSEPDDVLAALARRFQVTQSEREHRGPSGEKTFEYRVNLAVAQSRRIGWIESTEAVGVGIWKLSDAYYDDTPG